MPERMAHWVFTVAMENAVDTPSVLYGAQGWLENSLIEPDKRERGAKRRGEGERDTRLRSQSLG